MDRIKIGSLKGSEKYSKNYEGVIPDGTLPCIVCGKAVHLTDITNYVHVGNGGSDILPPGEEDHPASDLGLQPIGATCLRLNPQVKPYIHHT